MAHLYNRLLCCVKKTVERSKHVQLYMKINQVANQDVQYRLILTSTRERASRREMGRLCIAQKLTLVTAVGEIRGSLFSLSFCSKCLLFFRIGNSKRRKMKAVVPRCTVYTSLRNGSCWAGTQSISPVSSSPAPLTVISTAPARRWRLICSHTGRRALPPVCKPPPVWILPAH